MKDPIIPLQDILREIDFLQSLRRRSTFESFKDNSADVRAASYALLIISEAVRRVPEEWLDAHPDIPWHAIRMIGNKLRHEYHRVSEVILWDVICSHLHPLEAATQKIIAARSQH